MKLCLAAFLARQMVVSAFERVAGLSSHLNSLSFRLKTKSISKDLCAVDASGLSPQNSVTLCNKLALSELI